MSPKGTPRFSTGLTVAKMQDAPINNADTTLELRGTYILS
jgi:hypothetical protein